MGSTLFLPADRVIARLLIAILFGSSALINALDPKEWRRKGEESTVFMIQQQNLLTICFLCKMVLSFRRLSRTKALYKPYISHR